MFGNISLAVLVGVWATSTATLAITEPDRTIMFCRMFAAVFIGFGRTIGL